MLSYQHESVEMSLKKKKTRLHKGLCQGFTQHYVKLVQSASQDM